MIFFKEIKPRGGSIMEITLIALIVVFILIITLGIQIQIRGISKKMDELLKKKS